MTEPYPNKDNEFVAWYPLGLSAAHSPDVWRQRRSGYYVHIPFCTAICDYCGFAVERLKGARPQRYLEALKQEIERYATSGRLANHHFVCGHFGGGTPSAIEAGDLMAIKSLIDSSFDVAPDAEVTVEVNPISFTLAKAEGTRTAALTVSVSACNPSTTVRSRQLGGPIERRTYTTPSRSFIRSDGTIIRLI